MTPIGLAVPATEGVATPAAQSVLEPIMVDPPIGNRRGKVDLDLRITLIGQKKRPHPDWMRPFEAASWGEETPDQAIDGVRSGGALHDVS